MAKLSKTAKNNEFGWLHKLEALRGEFDALLARMQGAKSRAAMKSAFDASPRQLGKATVAAARSRG